MDLDVKIKVAEKEYNLDLSDGVCKDIKKIAETAFGESRFKDKYIKQLVKADPRYCESHINIGGSIIDEVVVEAHGSCLKISKKFHIFVDKEHIDTKKQSVFVSLDIDFNDIILDEHTPEEAKRRNRVERSIQEFLSSRIEKDE